METPTCHLCNRTFARPSGLNVHLKGRCLVQKQQQAAADEQARILMDGENARLKEENVRYREENIKLRIQLEFLTKVEARADKLENHILQENSKPRVMINLAPYDIDHVKRICETYTTEDFNRGPEATYDFLLKKCLTADDGRKLLKCTDTARHIFKGVKNDGTEFIDVGGSRLECEIVKPLKRAVKKAGDQLYDIDLDEEDCRDIERRAKSHNRALEPARIKRRLAGDLR